MKIAIRTKKEMFYPPYNKGIIYMEVDLIQNKPLEEIYELRIKDYCIGNVEEDKITYTNNETGEIIQKTSKVTVQKQIGVVNNRQNIQSYEKVKYLVQTLQKQNPAIKEMDLDDAIMEAFRQGLYNTTAQELSDGINWYGTTDISEWEIVRE